MKDKLAIFDMDGTLFDTSETNYHAYHEALMPFSVQLDHDYFVSKCNGRHYTEFLPEIMGSTAEIEEVHKRKKEAYALNLKYAKLNVHLMNNIKMIRNDYYTAIVTTASKKNTLEILQFFDCQELFDLILTQEDICHVKPNPEGFLKAMSFFNIDPFHTIIYEDSDVGIEAAKASGATVIKIISF